MSKKVIAVDINEIFRSLWIQFDRYYVEEFGEEGAPDDELAYVYDFWKNYEWKDTTVETKELKEDAPESISPTDYVLNEDTGESNADFLLFEKKTEDFTAREMYNKFMYEDFCMDIFGFAPKMYPQVDKDSDQFYLKFKDQFDLALVSKENWFSIAPTLFFLAKVTPRFNSYFFYEENKEIWDRVDYLITTDPELIESKPEGKKVIKLDRPFNHELEGDVVATNLIDLVDSEEFKKLINYIEEKEKIEE